MSLIVYNINVNKIEDINFKELIKGFKSFKGVSFVGKYKIIEEILLPNFEQVDLILGLEDEKKSVQLHQIFDFKEKSDILTSFKDNTINRLYDSTLQFRYTKKDLFHSKYFILESDSNVRIINGSMNLTEKAINENHEMIWYLDTIPQSDIHKQFLEIFTKNWEVDSTEWIDRKTIEVIKNSENNTKRDITIALIDSITEHTDNDVVNKVIEINPDIVHKNNIEIQYEIQENVISIAKQYINKKGTIRNVKPEERKLKTKTIFTNKLSGVSKESFETFNKSLVYDKDEGHIVLNNSILKPNEVTQRDKETLRDLILSYKVNKNTDESQQMLTAIAYTFTSPLIWKIREIYRKNEESHDKVPLSLALLGDGSSGKTFMLNNSLKPLIGDTHLSKAVDWSELSDTRGTNINKHLNHMSDYMYSGYIMPHFIDEVAPAFFKGMGETRIKEWSNTLKDVNGVNIIASNAKDAMAGLQEQIQKRVLFVNIDNPFKDPELQKYDYNKISRNITPNIYHNVIVRLNEKLKNITDFEIKLLKDDYLHLTKEILKDILGESIVLELGDRVWEKYDYRKVKMTKEWELLILTDKGHSIEFDRDNPEVAIILDNMFRKEGKHDKNVMQEFNTYYNSLPPAVKSHKANNSMIVNIDAFDNYIGKTMLRDLRDRRYNTKLVNKNDELTQELLKTLIEQNKKENEKPKGFIEKVKYIFKN